MKCQKLKYLFLNNNRINYITIFKTLKLKELRLVSLKENSIVFKNKEVQNIIKEMKEANIYVEIE